MSLIAGIGFATPCKSIHRSCLVLKNQYSQFAKIECNWLSEVASSANSQGSTQLDLSYGDGLGSPEPRQLYCTLTTGQSTRDFNFYNPTWGPLIEFNLISDKQLDVYIADRWGSKETNYTFKW